MIRTLTIALTLIAGPAVAQPTLEPARLAAAQTLIDVVMPASQRETMVDGLMVAMSRNMKASMDASFGKMRDKDQRVATIVDRFVTRNLDAGRTTMRTALPGMIAAMQRAYARRFTVAQMAEMQVFFASPTGRLYMEQGPTIMSDPDVAAWQTSVMTAQLARMRDETRALQLEVLALPEKVAK